LSFTSKLNCIVIASLARYKDFKAGKYSPELFYCVCLCLFFVEH